MPQAILLQDVESLGERGAVVDVSRRLPAQLPAAAQARRAGHARARSRRPRGAASAAERAQREAEERAQENAALLGRTVLTIPQQAGDDGRLFGSVTPQDIADAIRDARGIRVDRRKIHLEEPIRNVGTYMVVVEVADGVTATVKTMVVAALTAARWTRRRRPVSIASCVALVVRTRASARASERVALAVRPRARSAGRSARGRALRRSSARPATEVLADCGNWLRRRRRHRT